MLLARKFYNADMTDLGFSVPATEHSVMTALGREGEFEMLDRFIHEHPKGVISCVGDSYDYYAFVDEVCRQAEAILARDGKFVVRPDSTTPTHRHPEDLVLWTANRLWATFGGETNDNKFKVLDPHIGVLWGDGLSPAAIEKILSTLTLAGFSAENFVFGMGGGLVQKGVDRDQQRFAFKASAMRTGVEDWRDVYKHPLQLSKASKKGRLALVSDGEGRYHTVREGDGEDLLQTVYENGDVVREYTFTEVRENARRAVDTTPLPVSAAEIAR